MGTILTALTRGKQLCIMPRQFRFGEHRNDHQVATVERLEDYPGLYKAHDEDDLPACLNEALKVAASSQAAKIDEFAPQEFTRSLRAFILSPGD